MASGEELLAKTQCRYHQAYHSHSAPDRPVPPIEALTIHRCGSPSWRLATREADAKWSGARSPTSQTKRHVNCCIQSVTDEPFLNRVSQVRILPGAPSQSHKPALSSQIVVRGVVQNSNCGSPESMLTHGFCAARSCHGGGVGAAPHPMLQGGHCPLAYFSA